jgi:WD40 repeat protein
VDTASGSLVVDLQAHEGAVWSLAVRPDGKGFVSASADKDVKFWDFTVSTVSMCCETRCVHYVLYCAVMRCP